MSAGEGAGSWAAPSDERDADVPASPRPPLPLVGEGLGVRAGPEAPGVTAEPEAGAAAFEFLVMGVRECVAAGLAPPVDPARVALNVWTALHGLVSLRGSLPGFPWPPLTQQVDDLLHGLVGLRAAGPVDQK